MGRDKALMPVEGLWLIDLVVMALRETPGVEGVHAIGRESLPEVQLDGCLPDEQPGNGPIGGLVTALRALRTPHVLVVAADMPSLRPAVLAEMIAKRGEHQAVVPRWGGHAQPLCAVYSRAILPHAEALIAAGRRSLHSLLDGLDDIRWLDEGDLTAIDPRGLTFVNLNDEADLRRWRADALPRDH
jgi:molybdopterin-guanine dinucleotide biosynthesis protein A